MKFLFGIALLLSLVVNITAQFPWNLDRIDSREYVLDGQYTYIQTGAGVKVYVVDSGVQLNHPEFEGRVIKGYGQHTGLCDGHATGVAGVLGSTSYGVAKQVTIVSVKVRCIGTPTVGDVIKGLDWVYRDAKRSKVSSIALIPLSGAMNVALNDAVRKLTTVGVLTVTSAGNDGHNACFNSPASVLEALVVGGTTSDDRALSYSNYGTCVDLYAPGEGVWTIWNDSPTTVTYMSGTSFAAPHAAGVAAMYLELYPNASPAEVHDAVTGNATLLSFGLMTYSIF